MFETVFENFVNAFNESESMYAADLSNKTGISASMVFSWSDILECSVFEIYEFYEIYGIFPLSPDFNL